MHRQSRGESILFQGAETLDPHPSDLRHLNSARLDHPMRCFMNDDARVEGYDDVSREIAGFVKLSEHRANTGLVLRPQCAVDLVHNPRDVLLDAGVAPWVLLLNEAQRGLDSLCKGVTLAPEIGQAHPIYELVQQGRHILASHRVAQRSGSGTPGR